MNIFITGASGYIGGSLAIYFTRAGHHVRGLIRDARKSQQVGDFGIDVVLGDLNDEALLTHEARRADAVINTADSDHQGAVNCFIQALSGSNKTLLHTSGISIIGDASAGNILPGAAFDEYDSFPIAAEKKHRWLIDNSVLSASGVRGIVLCNSLIYGNSLMPHTQSVQLPALIKQSQVSGVMRIVGAGLNHWSTVHIDDLCKLYELALTGAPAGAFYFSENGNESFRTIAEALCRRLGNLSIECLSESKAIQCWGLSRTRFSLGSNCLVTSTRAKKELGWSPKHNSLKEWILNEMVVPNATQSI